MPTWNDFNGDAGVRTYVVEYDSEPRGNTAPIANAGPHQNVLVTETTIVTLDGSGSTDVDEDLLTFNWSFISVPSGSTATLSDPVAENPTFVVDKPGTYIVQLIVNDGTLDSPPDRVTITGSVGGSVVAWGDNTHGQCTVPAPNEDFVAISGGYWHSVGLKVDGSIVAWGNNADGQCNVPLPNTGFVAVAAGYGHSVGLKADGSVVAWGSNYDDHGHYTAQCIVPAPNEGFVAIAAGLFHNLGLKADGSIVAWGRNEEGQRNLPTPNTGFKAVGCGDFHSMGIKADGSIIAWGYNWFGQCNVTPPNTGFVQTDGGWRHTLGLQTDGSIRAWGSNGDWYRDVHGNWTFEGLCNIPAPNANFVRIVSGSYHSLAMKADGRIVAWGRNDWGQCNVPEPDSVFFAIAGGQIHSLALKVETPLNHAPAANAGPHQNVLLTETVTLDGSGSTDVDEDLLTFNWTFISKPLGSTATLSDPVAKNPTFVVDKPGTYIVQLIVNDGTVDSPPDWVAITSCVPGLVVAWGDNTHGQCTVPAPNEDFVAISGGYWHSVGLKVDGSIVAWGNNAYGQCNVPLPNTGFVAVAAGWGHTVGLRADGSVVAWGSNQDDHGHNTYQCIVPAPNEGFVAIAAGLFHNLGLKSDGSIVAWGRNEEGQRNLPTPNTGFKAIGCGDFHSMGIKADGSIIAWGYNPIEFGQCNITPPNTGFVQTDGGWRHTLGLHADGSIRVWGYNGYWGGQWEGLCDVPAPNADFVKLVSGSYHSLAMKADGRIVAWGRNDWGQCNVPEPDTVFFAIAGGQIHSLAIKKPNSPPVPNAGAEVTIHWTQQDVTTVHGVAFDPDPGSVLMYRWLDVTVGEAVVLLDWTSAGPAGQADLSLAGLPPFPIGQSVLRLEVSDGSMTSADEMVLTIINLAPAAEAGDNVMIRTDMQATTTILGLALDIDGDPLIYRWLDVTNGAAILLLDWGFVGDNGEAWLDLAQVPPFDVGQHVLRLKVTDGLESSYDDMILTMENSPPVATIKGGGTYRAGDPIVVGGDISDFDGDLVEWSIIEGVIVLASGQLQTSAGGNPVAIADVDLSAQLAVGTHKLYLTAFDGHTQAKSEECIITVIQDAEPPTLAPQASVTQLWPPNHELVPVTITVNALDNSDGPICLDVSVISDNPVNSQGDGTTEPDWIIDAVEDGPGGFVYLRLRSERPGKGVGRTYTITIVATDIYGNTSSAQVVIKAPHDKGKR